MSKVSTCFSSSAGVPQTLAEIDATLQELDSGEGEVIGKGRQAAYAAAAMIAAAANILPRCPNTINLLQRRFLSGESRD
jgi:hypothetical protein